MKKLNFNRSVSSLRNLEDVKKPRKKINWDKIVYFIVLGLIIFFFLRYAFNKTLYVEAPGQVYFSSVKVRLPEDVTLNKFKVLEGDSVSIGDTLFSYIPADHDDEGFGNISISGIGLGARPKSSSSKWHEKEIYQLEKKIELTRLKIVENIFFILRINNWFVFFQN